MATLGAPQQDTMKLTPAQVGEYQRERYFNRIKLIPGFVP